MTAPTVTCPCCGLDKSAPYTEGSEHWYECMACECAWREDYRVQPAATDKLKGLRTEVLEEAAVKLAAYGAGYHSMLVSDAVAYIRALNDQQKEGGV